MDRISLTCDIVPSTGGDGGGRVSTVRTSTIGSRAELPELYLTARDKREILSHLLMRESTYRYAIAGFAVLFALIGVSILFSREGPRTPLERLVDGYFFVSTVPIGIAMSRMNHAAVWWSSHTGFRHAPELFVAYADVGLAAALLTL